jgi:hypothetical protein
VSIVNSPARIKITTPKTGPRIGTKLRRKATVPQRIGSPTPVNDITNAVAIPTAVFMAVIVTR